MSDSVLIFLIQHILLFGVVFWALTLLNMVFNKKKNHFYKKKFYECGFNSLTDINIQININFLLIGIFLILYDIEFTFLFPFLFNITYVNLINFIFFTIFFLLIILSLLYDWQSNALDWQY